MTVISNLFLGTIGQAVDHLRTCDLDIFFFVLELASSCDLELFYIRALPHGPGTRKKKGSD